MWAPDGKHLVFRSVYGTSSAIWWIRTDGAGEAQRLLDVSTADMGPNSLSPDGRLLIYSHRDGDNYDLWTVSLDLTDPDHPKPGKPEPVFRSPFSEWRPAFSRDGRWVAYTSDESGRSDVYVRSFSGTASSPGGKWQVSTGGGGPLLWSLRGRELFFANGDRIMATQYTTLGGSFAADRPRLWSSTRILSDTGFTNDDLAPDGQRFAIFVRPEAAARDMPRVTFLLNFFDELHRRLP